MKVPYNYKWYHGGVMSDGQTDAYNSMSDKVLKHQESGYDAIELMNGCHNLIEQCNPINLPVYDNPPLQEGRYYQNDSKVVFYICELLLDTVSYRLMNPTTGSLTKEFTKYRNYFSDNIIYKEYSN